MARPCAQSRLTSIERYRGQVLAHPLAGGISPDEVRDHLAKVPRQRFPRVAYANRGPSPCIQPRGGVPLFENKYHLTRHWGDAGANFIPLTTDTYTRHNQYDTATQL